MRTIALASLTALALTAGGGAAGAPTGGSWLAPVGLSDEARNAANVVVGADAAGDTIVAWVDVQPSRQTLLVRIRPAGGTFGAQEQIAAGEFVWPARLAVNGRGDAVLLATATVSGVGHLEAAFRPARGRFSAAEDVVSPPANVGVGMSDAAIDARGNVTVVWAANAGVRAARRKFGGRFAQPQTLGPGSYPTVGASPAGEAVAAWASGSAFGHVVVHAAIRPAAATVFGAARDVSTPSDIPCCVSVGVNARGDAVVAWPAYTRGSVTTVRAAVRPAGAGFGQEETVGGPVVGSCALAVDAGGGVTAAWLADDYVLFPLFVTYRPPGGSFAPQQEVSPDAGSVALASGMLVWSRFAGDYVVQAAPLQNGVVGPVRNLSQPGYNAVPATLAVDVSGDAVAAWPRSNGATFFVQLSAYDAAGPRLGALRVPARAHVGERVDFSAAPLDVWSPVASIRWSFGDGARATGRHVRHAYARAGRYVVRVTSADTLGHATTAAGTIVVGRRS